MDTIGCFLENERVGLRTSRWFSFRAEPSALHVCCHCPSAVLWLKPVGAQHHSVICLLPPSRWDGGENYGGKKKKVEVMC